MVAATGCESNGLMMSSSDVVQTGDASTTGVASCVQTCMQLGDQYCAGDPECEGDLYFACEEDCSGG